MRRYFITLIIFEIVQSFLLLCNLFGEEDTTTFYRDDSNSIQLVLADLVTLEEDSRPFVRYLVAPPEVTANWVHAANYVINAVISRAHTIQYGVVLPGAHLIRYDLRELAPNPTELSKLIALWDSLSVLDPYYHINHLTADQFLIEGLKEKFGDDISIVAPHIEEIVAQITTDLNFSPSLAYRFDFFLTQVLSAENFYYQFLQIPPRKEGQSDLDAILASKGINLQQVEQLNSDKRVAMFASGVTSRPRSIVTATGNGGLRIWLTEDIAENSIQVEQHPIYSLLDFKPDGGEGIFERPNGSHEYYLFNSQNNLVQAVPDVIARDGTIPFPFISRLVPGISCIRCHGDTGGLKVVQNDVATILTSGFAVFDDIQGLELNLTQEEVIDRLEALYSGRRFQIYLDRGRLDHEFFNLELLNNPNIPPEVSPFGLISEEISKIWSRYLYEYVNAERAVIEITGRLDPLESELETYSEILVKTVGRYNPEDPSIAALMAGLKIRRADFERVYASAALRYFHETKKLKAGEEK